MNCLQDLVRQAGARCSYPRLALQRPPQGLLRQAVVGWDAQACY